MKIKTVLLLCLITQVLRIHGLKQLKNSLATSDSPLLKKILQLVDAVTNDEQLLQVTLKLLQSLCVCMRETLETKENIFYIGNHSLDTNKSNYIDGKVFELYKNIYNNTCFNLRQELIDRTHNFTVEDEIDFLNHTNCGKIEKNETNLKGYDVDGSPKLPSLEDVLFKALIQTRDLHKYRLRRYDLFGKGTPHTQNVLLHSLIVILTLHPEEQEINSAQNYVDGKELNNTLYRRSTINVDIINTKQDQRRKEKNESTKAEIISDCNIKSLYKFLTECVRKNVVKVYKLIRKKITIKIYMELNLEQNHTDLLNICCKNGSVIPQCNKDLINYFITQNTQPPRFPDFSYIKTITKIKNLVKQYENKLNDTTYPNISVITIQDEKKGGSTADHRSHHTSQKNGTNTDHHKNNGVHGLATNTNDSNGLDEVTQAIVLLNDFVSKQTTQADFQPGQTDLNNTHSDKSKTNITSKEDREQDIPITFNPLNTPTVLSDNSREYLNKSTSSQYLPKNKENNKLVGVTLPVFFNKHNAKLEETTTTNTDINNDNNTKLNNVNVHQNSSNHDNAATGPTLINNDELTTFPSSLLITNETTPSTTSNLRITQNVKEHLEKYSFGQHNTTTSHSTSTMIAFTVPNVENTLEHSLSPSMSFKTNENLLSDLETPTNQVSKEFITLNLSTPRYTISEDLKKSKKESNTPDHLTTLPTLIPIVDSTLYGGDQTLSQVQNTSDMKIPINFTYVTEGYGITEPNNKTINPTISEKGDVSNVLSHEVTTIKYDNLTENNNEFGRTLTMNESDKGDASEPTATKTFPSEIPYTKSDSGSTINTKYLNMETNIISSVFDHNASRYTLSVEDIQVTQKDRGATLSTLNPIVDSTLYDGNQILNKKQNTFGITIPINSTHMLEDFPSDEYKNKTAKPLEERYTNETTTITYSQLAENTKEIGQKFILNELQQDDIINSTETKIFTSESPNTKSILETRNTKQLNIEINTISLTVLDTKTNSKPEEYFTTDLSSSRPLSVEDLRNAQKKSKYITIDQNTTFSTLIPIVDNYDGDQILSKVQSTSDMTVTINSTNETEDYASNEPYNKTTELLENDNARYGLLDEKTTKLDKSTENVNENGITLILEQTQHDDVINPTNMETYTSRFPNTKNILQTTMTTKIQNIEESSTHKSSTTFSMSDFTKSQNQSIHDDMTGINITEEVVQIEPVKFISHNAVEELNEQDIRTNHTKLSRTEILPLTTSFSPSTQDNNVTKAYYKNISVIFNGSIGEAKLTANYTTTNKTSKFKTNKESDMTTGLLANTEDTTVVVQDTIYTHFNNSSEKEIIIQNANTVVTEVGQAIKAEFNKIGSKNTILTKHDVSGEYISKPQNITHSLKHSNKHDKDYQTQLFLTTITSEPHTKTEKGIYTTPTSNKYAVTVSVPELITTDEHIENIEHFGNPVEMQNVDVITESNSELYENQTTTEVNYINKEYWTKNNFLQKPVVKQSTETPLLSESLLTNTKESNIKRNFTNVIENNDLERTSTFQEATMTSYNETASYDDTNEIMNPTSEIPSTYHNSETEVTVAFNNVKISTDSETNKIIDVPLTDANKLLDKDLSFLSYTARENNFTLKNNSKEELSNVDTSTKSVAKVVYDISNELLNQNTTSSMESERMNVLTSTEITPSEPEFTFDYNASTLANDLLPKHHDVFKESGKSKEKDTTGPATNSTILSSLNLSKYFTTEVYKAVDKEVTVLNMAQHKIIISDLMLPSSTITIEPLLESVTVSRHLKNSTVDKTKKIKTKNLKNAITDKNLATNKLISFATHTKTTTTTASGNDKTDKFTNEGSRITQSKKENKSDTENRLYLENYSNIKDKLTTAYKTEYTSTTEILTINNLSFPIQGYPDNIQTSLTRSEFKDLKHSIDVEGKQESTLVTPKSVISATSIYPATTLCFTDVMQKITVNKQSTISHMDTSEKREHLHIETTDLKESFKTISLDEQPNATFTDSLKVKEVTKIKDSGELNLSPKSDQRDLMSKLNEKHKSTEVKTRLSKAKSTLSDEIKITPIFDEITSTSTQSFSYNPYKTETTFVNSLDTLNETESTTLSKSTPKKISMGNKNFNKTKSPKGMKRIIKSDNPIAFELNIRLGVEANKDGIKFSVIDEKETVYNKSKSRSAQTRLSDKVTKFKSNKSARNDIEETLIKSKVAKKTDTKETLTKRNKVIVLKNMDWKRRSYLDNNVIKLFNQSVIGSDLPQQNFSVRNTTINEEMQSNQTNTSNSLPTTTIIYSNFTNIKHESIISGALVNKIAINITSDDQEHIEKFKESFNFTKNDNKSPVEILNINLYNNSGVNKSEINNTLQTYGNQEYLNQTNITNSVSSTTLIYSNFTNIKHKSIIPGALVNKIAINITSVDKENIEKLKESLNLTKNENTSIIDILNIDLYNNSEVTISEMNNTLHTYGNQEYLEISSAALFGAKNNSKLGLIEKKEEKNKSKKQSKKLVNIFRTLMTKKKLTKPQLRKIKNKFLKYLNNRRRNSAKFGARRSSSRLNSDSSLSHQIKLKSKHNSKTTYRNTSTEIMTQKGDEVHLTSTPVNQTFGDNEQYDYTSTSAPNNKVATKQMLKSLSTLLLELQSVNITTTVPSENIFDSTNFVPNSDKQLSKEKEYEYKNVSKEITNKIDNHFKNIAKHSIAKLSNISKNVSEEITRFLEKVEDVIEPSSANIQNLNITTQSPNNDNSINTVDNKNKQSRSSFYILGEEINKEMNTKVQDIFKTSFTYVPKHVVNTDKENSGHVLEMTNTSKAMEEKNKNLNDVKKAQHIPSSRELLELDNQHLVPDLIVNKHESEILSQSLKLPSKLSDDDSTLLLPTELIKNADTTKNKDVISQNSTDPQFIPKIAKITKLVLLDPFKKVLNRNIGNKDKLIIKGPIVTKYTKNTVNNTLKQLTSDVHSDNTSSREVIGHTIPEIQINKANNMQLLNFSVKSVNETGTRISNIMNSTNDIVYNKSVGPLEFIKQNRSKRLQDNTSRNNTKSIIFVKNDNGEKNISLVSSPTLTHLKATDLYSPNKITANLKPEAQKLLLVSHYPAKDETHETMTKDYQNNFENQVKPNTQSGIIKNKQGIQIFSSRVHRPDNSLTTTTAVTKSIKYNTYRPLTNDDLVLLNVRGHIVDEAHSQILPFNGGLTIKRVSNNQQLEFGPILNTANYAKGDQMIYTEKKHHGVKDLHPKLEKNLNQPIKAINTILYPILETNTNSPQITSNVISHTTIEMHRNLLLTKNNKYSGTAGINYNSVPMEINRNLILEKTNRTRNLPEDNTNSSAIIKNKWNLLPMINNYKLVENTNLPLIIPVNNREVLSVIDNNGRLLMKSSTIDNDRSLRTMDATISYSLPMFTFGLPPTVETIEKSTFPVTTFIQTTHPTVKTTITSVSVTERTETSQTSLKTRKKIRPLKAIKSKPFFTFESNGKPLSMTEKRRNTQRDLPIKTNAHSNIIRKKIKRKGPREETLLNTFGTSNPYAVKIKTPEAKITQSKRIRIGNRKKPVMTMNTQDFLSQHRFVTPRSVKQTNTISYLFPTQSIPKTILGPKFKNKHHVSKIFEHPLKPETISVIKSDIFQKNLKAYRLAEMKRRQNNMYPGQKVQEMLSNAKKGKPNYSFDMPLLGTTLKPKYLKDRADPMPKFIFSDYYNNMKLTRRPVFNEESRVSKYPNSFRGDYTPRVINYSPHEDNHSKYESNNDDSYDAKDNYSPSPSYRRKNTEQPTTEASSKTPRRGRTIFFLSPTISYEQY